nr:MULTISPECIES: ChaN family lipoprotein [Pontibacter]
MYYLRICNLTDVNPPIPEMRYSNLLILLLLMVTITVSAQDKPAYKLFTKDGKDVTYGKMLGELKKADVVLFGEQHNDPIAHWLQLEVAKPAQGPSAKVKYRGRNV